MSGALDGRMDGTLLAVRGAMAAVWLYNGLWLKCLVRDPHHLEIVAAAVGGTGLAAGTALSLIGAGETLLAVGILSGIWWRFVNGFQIGLLVLMNGLGIVFGGGAIERPMGLVISNLPLVACAAMVLVRGPGKFRLGRGA